MYTGKHAHLRPLQPAFIMADTSEAVTYAEMEARSNRLAHLFRKLGLKRLDHYAIFMENNSRYLEACGAREALKQCPKVELCIVVDGASESERVVGLQEATSGLPKTPIADESIGTAM